ncbi:ComF family protein [Candidatus Parcubacteria bacterium]|nr:ComF family protein [Candidatus Parcubacteria bacterium]
MLAFGRNLYSAGLSLLFPRQCVGCGTEGAYLCSACAARLVKLPGLTCLACGRRRPDGRTCGACRKKLNLTGLVASLSYGDPLARELIHELKYQRVREITTILAHLVAGTLREFAPHLTRDAVFVPVPLHPSRLHERGFNQAELLAASLAATFNLPLVPAIIRTRRTKPQVELSNPDLRRANVAGAFALSGNARILPRVIVLVDDVATTGATLSACARALRSAGAREVWGVVVAR